MQDAWRSYLELALGLTEASTKKAQKVAKRLTSKGGATAGQLQALAEDLVTTSLANREALTKLVRFEVDRALGVVGLATAEEVADLKNRVRELEAQLREAEARAESAGGPAARSFVDGANADHVSAPSGVAAKKTVAKKTAAKKAVVKKTAAKKSAPAAGPADEPATRLDAAPARKATRAKKGAPAKKAAKTTPAKKAAKKAPTKKAASPGAGS